MNKIYKINNNLEYINITHKILTQKILLISIAILYFFSSFRNEVKFVQKIVNKTDTIYISKPIEKDIILTEKEIVNELIKQNCFLPNIALAQFIKESQHFKSNICKENKNIAGIKYSKSKYCIGENRGHAVYKTYKDCISDYIRIQNRFLVKIDGVYAEDKNYIKDLKKIKLKNDNNIRKR